MAEVCHTGRSTLHECSQSFAVFAKHSDSLAVAKSDVELNVIILSNWLLDSVGSFGSSQVIQLSRRLNNLGWAETV